MLKPQKISLLGTEASGKTTLLAALSHALDSVTTLPRITAQNATTRRYTVEIYDHLERGEWWAYATNAGTLRKLRWLWHARDESQHELQIFDYSGAEIRNIFESESDEQLAPFELELKKEFYSSDLIFLLINLQDALDIYNVPGRNNARIDIEFAVTTSVRKLHQQGLPVYVLFTQYDRYQERVKRDWNGDVLLALQALLPDLHAALVETGSAMAVVAAVETELRNGELLPKIGCKTGDLTAVITSIDDFLVQNAPVVAQREQQCIEVKQREQQLEEQREKLRQREEEVNKFIQRMLHSNTSLLRSKPPQLVPPPFLPLMPSSAPLRSLLSPSSLPSLPPSSQKNLFPIPAINPNASRADNAMSAIFGVLALDVLLFCLEWTQYIVLSPDYGKSNKTVNFFIHFAWPVCCIYSMVMFIRWFWRAYENVQLLVGETRIGTIWACAAWFIPYINLYRPYQIMKEIFYKTNEFLKKRGEMSNLKMSTIRGWWFLWIISHLFGVLLFNRPSLLHSPVMAKNFTVISMIYHVIDIPLCLLTIRLIKRHSEAEIKLGA